MRKKLLAGILALALCSTNMPPQTIFAGEFTSGNPDVVSEEETPEIFTNEEQEAVEALVALGYSSADALRAVRKVTDVPPDDVEGLLKAALMNF